MMHVRTCRRLLGVREDTPDELLKLQVLDSRIVARVASPLRPISNQELVPEGTVPVY